MKKLSLVIYPTKSSKIDTPIPTSTTSSAPLTYESQNALLALMNNVELIRQFAEDLWDNKDFTSIDRLFAEDSVLHSPLGNLVGLKENHDGMRTWIEGMPDLGVETIDIFENENKVIWQWTAEGTHLGNFMDIPPSGNKIHYQGCSIYQFQDNKVKEYWAYVNLDMIKAQMRGDMLEGV